MITDEQREALGLLDERKDFYFKVENAVIDSEDVFDNIFESMLYIVLARYIVDSRLLPSTKELAKKCYCEEENIVLALGKLVEKNLLIKLEYARMTLFSLKKVGGGK